MCVCVYRSFIICYIGFENILQIEIIICTKVSDLRYSCSFSFTIFNIYYIIFKVRYSHYGDTSTN